MHPETSQPADPIFPRKIIPLYAVFIVTFLLGYFLLLENKKIAIPRLAPHGIISFELNSDYERDTAVIGIWRRAISPEAPVDTCARQNDPLIQIARTNVQVDFVFIPFYVLLITLLILYMRSHKIQEREPDKPVQKKWQLRIEGFFSKQKWWFILLVIGAGVLDVVENVGMLCFINADNYDFPGRGVTGLKSAAAIGKFVLLGVVVMSILFELIAVRDCLRYISRLAHDRAKQIYQYRIIILGIIIFVAPMLVLDQGQDLLVNSNASRKGILLFILLTILIAFLNWYFSKLFFPGIRTRPVFPLEELDAPTASDDIRAKKMSRFLGVVTIVLPAIAILNALRETGIPYFLDDFHPMVLFFTWALSFFVLIRYDVVYKLFERLKQDHPRSAKYFAIATIVSLSIVLPYLFQRTKGILPNSTATLINLYWQLIFQAFSFYVFVSIRGLFIRGTVLGKRIGILILLLSITGSIFFIFANIWPLVVARWDVGYLALPLLMSSVIFYIFSLTLIARLSRRLAVNIFLFIVVFSFIVQGLSPNRYHNVSLRQIQVDTITRSTGLSDYFAEWIWSRRREIFASDSQRLFPIVLVNTHGGGVRAAAFTSMVFTYLDSLMLVDYKKTFQHYIFSISGASGGTIGAAIHCAYRQKNMDNAAAYRVEKFTNFYQRDFLTPVLVSALGRDILGGAIPLFKWKDRSGVQEDAWNYFAFQNLGIDMSRSFEYIFSTRLTTAYEVPLLFSNTLNVDDGLKGICAPIRLEKQDFPATIFINDRVDSLNLRFKSKEKYRYISLSSGSFLSARFPFISPSGKIGAGYHFIDGGGKDNSGASTSDLIFNSIVKYTDLLGSEDYKRTPKEDTIYGLIGRCRFLFLSVSSSPGRNDSRRLVEDRMEIISPLVGIINSGIEGNAVAADQALELKYSDTTKTYQGLNTSFYPIFPTIKCLTGQDGDGKRPVLPLGWQISAPALRRLDRSLRVDTYSGAKHFYSLVRKIYPPKEDKP